MRILYVASDQTVPGQTGGSVHVLEVARGLAARGHAVHAVVHRSAGAPAREQGEGVVWHRVDWIPPWRLFRFRARGAVERIAAEMTPEVIIERYYNFGGEGLATAAGRGVPSLLEVNSPVLDHPRALKALIDSALLVRPMRAYRESLCRRASALVSPLPEIVPEFARSKTVTVTWGANTETFRPRPDRAQLRRELDLPQEATVVVFSGSFRPWHGVPVLEEAARRLRHRPDLYFLLVGGARIEPGRGYRGRRLGSQPYELMPRILAAADIGVAPYDPARLAQLQLGFYWSPLKVFEYMATGLPTLTIARAPLTEIVRSEQEGLHFHAADAADLARQIERLADDRALRGRLGAAARERVTTHYSWARHCAQLEQVLRDISA